MDARDNLVWMVALETKDLKEMPGLPARRVCRVLKVPRERWVLEYRESKAHWETPVTLVHLVPLDALRPAAPRTW